MKPHRQQKLILITLCLVFVAAAATLAGFAFKNQIDLFYSPTDVHNGLVQTDRSFRAGGLVKYDSLHRDPDTLMARFVITDQVHDLAAQYQGILPDLFREGQGIVATGMLTEDGIFVASEVLAKHDETYMPAEVKDALERAGKSGFDHDYLGYGAYPQLDSDAGAGQYE